jgi:hypothetical protein
MKEFFELKLESMTIDEYEIRFLELLKYVSFVKDEIVKIDRYLSGFPSFISDTIKYDDPKTLEESIRRAKFLYDQQRARPTFQKSWEDKKKFKMDQRKKGTKPPFFKNNPQGQPTSREPRMMEIGGQRPMQPPIQCWYCKGDHMFKDCRHRGEKVRSIYIVQQAEIVEYMGINVPRIYASLDKKKEKYHTHMIEVEGMIHNQTMVILTDS